MVAVEKGATVRADRKGDRPAAVTKKISKRQKKTRWFTVSSGTR